DVERLQQELDDLKKKRDAARINAADRDAEYKQAQVAQTKAENELSAAEERRKRLRGQSDRYFKSAEQKRWKFGDTVRSLPIIDAFNPPVKIQQIHLPELTMALGSFVRAGRYDRCITCHVGIDRDNYDKSTLRKLRNHDEKLQTMITTFR